MPLVDCSVGAALHRTASHRPSKGNVPHVTARSGKLTGLDIRQLSSRRVPYLTVRGNLQAVVDVATRPSLSRFRPGTSESYPLPMPEMLADQGSNALQHKLRK